MRLTSKGQLTIPQALRQRYGLLPETEVEFEAVRGGVLIRPAGSARVRRLKAAMARSRGSCSSGLRTDDIMHISRGED